MGQVTIYIDADTEKKMKAAIQKKRISKSKWIAGLIKRETRNTWPEAVVQLAGAWSDLPEAEAIRKGLSGDAARETL